MFPFVLYVAIGSELRNKSVLLYSDNSTVDAILNKHTNQKHIRKLVRLLVRNTMRFNILFRAEHVACQLNI